MTPELIAILGIGVALAGLIWQGQRGLGVRIDRIEAELREIRDRLSRLEGKMDFLEAYIAGRNERPAAPAE